MKTFEDVEKLITSYNDLEIDNGYIFVFDHYDKRKYSIQPSSHWNGRNKGEAKKNLLNFSDLPSYFESLDELFSVFLEYIRIVFQESIKQKSDQVIKEQNFLNKWSNEKQGGYFIREDDGVNNDN